MKLSNEGLQKIKQREGVVLKVYLDSAGKKTAGMGHLLSPTTPLNVGDSITQQQSDAWAEQDLRAAEDAVNRNVKVRLTQNQFDALVSFVFNIGETNFRMSKLLRLLNQGEYLEAKEQFVRWHYKTVNGKKISDDGLINRRISEMAQFGNVDPSTQPPVSNTVSPSVAAPPNKVMQTTTGKLQATAVATGGAAAVIQGINQATPVVSGISTVHSYMYGMPPWLVYLSAALVLICIGACVGTLIYKHKDIRGE